MNGLNLKQEQFCQLYVNGDKELFGNGTRCYLEVYGQKDEKTGKGISYLAAMAAASRLLRSVKIIKRINELLEAGGFIDENVDKQHLFLINQHADFKSKLGAIREYNKLKKRVDDSPKVNVTVSLAQLLIQLDERRRGIKQTGEIPAKPDSVHRGNVEFKASASQARV